MQQCTDCVRILAGFRGSVLRPFSRLRSGERRATATLALNAVRSRRNEARAVMRVVERSDFTKLVGVLWLGRKHFVYLWLTMTFRVISSSLSSMHRWQGAEVTNFFTDYSRGVGRSAKTHIDMAGNYTSNLSLLVTYGSILTDCL